MIRIFSLLTFLLGCAQVTSLNLQKHEFGVQPRKIIWIQVAGLKPEHFALLKYDKVKAGYATSFEKFLCYGNIWQHNLYKLRPNINSSQLTQLTGKNNIKQSCEDYKHKAIWSYLGEQGYKTALFKTKIKSNPKKSCEAEKKNFYKNLIVWKMDRKAKKNINYFHLEKDDVYKKNKVYYDTACLTGKCFNSISKNIAATFERFNKNAKRFLYVFQDRSFYESLNYNNFNKAKRVLNELDLSIRYFQSYISENKDALLLVTGLNSLDINYPLEGKRWEQYLKRGKFISSNKSELVSPVMALGARAENFCGIYNQSEVLTRIFSGAKQQGLELKFINPFK